jgi:ribosomal protein S20
MVKKNLLPKNTAARRKAQLSRVAKEAGVKTGATTKKAAPAAKKPATKTVAKPAVKKTAAKSAAKPAVKKAPAKKPAAKK